MRDKRYAILVDGSNNAKATKAAGYMMDYDRVREHFGKSGTVVDCSYFTALPPIEQYTDLRALTDWLQLHSWTVVTKEVKELLNDEGMWNLKGNMDIEICMRCVRVLDTVDHFVLFTGDGDFVALVEYLKEKGKQVTAVSHYSHRGNSVVSQELRKAVTFFLPLLAMKSDFESQKPPRTPEQREARKRRFEDRG